jgi:hypothetical protein
MVGWGIEAAMPFAEANPLSDILSSTTKKTQTSKRH